MLEWALPGRLNPQHSTWPAIAVQALNGLLAFALACGHLKGRILESPALSSYFRCLSHGPCPGVVC